MAGMRAKFNSKRGAEREMKKINKLFLVAMLCFMTLIVQTMTIAQATDEEATRDLIPEEEMQSNSIDLRSLASDQEAKDTLPFPITLRDFQADGVIFEPKQGDVNVKQGFVTLDPETKKPQFTMEGIKHIAWNVQYDGVQNLKPAYDPAWGDWTYDRNYTEAVEWYDELKADPNYKYRSYTSIREEIGDDLYKYVVYHVDHLFEDVDGLNQRYEEQTFLPLEKKDNNMYGYSNDNFFPLDDKLFGNDGREHNYHFTLESHTQFYFGGDKDLEFTFKGDDDVWVFIDGIQVIDLGGTHVEAEQKIRIDKDGTVSITRPNSNEEKKLTLTLTPGWYDFDFFFMERRTSESNLNITTNMEFNPGIKLNKVAYLIDEKGEKKILDPEDDPKPLVYPGQTIYYKFQIENTGNVPLKNIMLTDDKLGLVVNSTGVYINGDRIEDYQITVGGKSVDDNPFGQLLSKDSAPDNTIEISSELFQYVVTDDDAVSGKVVNTATVTGTPENNEDINDVATVSVDVVPTPRLRLTKQVVDSDGGVINPVNKDDLFTIQVQAQDSGGEVFNVRLEARESVTLPVKYGVTYTIKEIVPMNYKLKSITINDIEQDEVTIKIEDSDYNVVITNEVTNTKWFQFKKRVANYVAKVMSGEGS